MANPAAVDRNTIPHESQSPLNSLQKAALASDAIASTAAGWMRGLDTRVSYSRFISSSDMPVSRAFQLSALRSVFLSKLIGSTGIPMTLVMVSSLLGSLTDTTMLRREYVSLTLTP